MIDTGDFTSRLVTKVRQQLRAKGVAYLLGAGSSYLDGAGYPLAFQLWDRIKDRIKDGDKRADIQSKLDGGASGIEHALDLLDDGGAQDTPYRHLVTEAFAGLFMPLSPPLDVHMDFVRRVVRQATPSTRIFSLNYDPLVERAAEQAKVRLIDGFCGAEHSFFEPAVFEECIGRIVHSPRRSRIDTTQSIHLLKLHGSLGWYEHSTGGIRRCAFGYPPPESTKRLMIPPQRRKAGDTMYLPYSALWSEFRGCLGQNAAPANRLVAIGYGFGDEHVNVVIEAALSRNNFNLLIFAKALSDPAWERWSGKRNTVVLTEERCSLQGEVGPGHINLWQFETIAKEI